jgi:transposase-like protein
MEKVEYWQRHDEEQRRSGLTIRAYCERHQLKKHNLNYWREKFRRTGAKSPKGFVRVVEKKQESETLVVARLTLSDGMVLECMTWPEVQWLRGLQT